ncbi:hypothetical protein Tco_1503659 [Tanacetum coccineum]
MMEADYELDQRLQAEEQGELTIKERSKLFVEVMDKRKKHFLKRRAKEIRRKPPSKAQKRNQMCTYLKNMANYKHSHLKNKSFEEIYMLFDNTMKWVDLFVTMDTEVVDGSKSQVKGSKKRTREELDFDNSKIQKIDENLEAEVDYEAEMKKHMEIVPDDEVAIDAIPLATKSPIIVVCYSELEIYDRSNEPSSSKLVPQVVAQADKTATSQQKLELLFSPMYEEYINAGNPSVSKSSTLFDNLQQHDT